MKIVNLSARELKDALEVSQEPGFPWGKDDHKYVIYDDDTVIGLYYKEFMDLNSHDKDELDRLINLFKESYDDINEWTWEYNVLGKIMGKINRIESAQKLVSSYDKTKNMDINEPIDVITGVALYNNYPVGVLLPKRLFKYKSLLELGKAGIVLTGDEIEMIFDQARKWVEALIAQNTFPHLYLGNIMVNPNDYSDVLLDGLDSNSALRIENDRYIQTMQQRGRYLGSDALRDFEDLRQSYYDMHPASKRP